MGNSSLIDRDGMFTDLGKILNRVMYNLITHPDMPKEKRAEFAMFRDSLIKFRLELMKRGRR